MKAVLYSSSIGVAVCVGILMLAPRSAPAASAEDTFVAIRQALLKSQATGTKQLVAKSVSTQSGNAKKSSKTATTGKAADVSDLIGVRYDPATGKLLTNKGGWTGDLNLSNYVQVKFGNSRTQLYLSPKGAPDRREIVEYDPNTKIPESWKSYTRKPTGWVNQAFLRFDLIDPANREYRFRRLPDNDRIKQRRRIYFVKPK